MGYSTFPGYQKSRLVEKILNDYAHDFTLLAHELVGNELWMVCGTVEKGEHVRFIELALLQQFPEGWGYKPMGELCGPYYYQCPLRFLELTTGPTNPKWRAAVLARRAGQPCA
jgi:hypothetical protein